MGMGSTRWRSPAVICVICMRWNARSILHSIGCCVVGVLHAGTIRNVVSDHACLEGTLRACQEAVFSHMKNELTHIAERYAPARFSFSFSEGYPALINDPALFQQAKDLLPQLICLEGPQLITEDFSWYLQHVPGVFFFLGTGTGIPLHSDHFDFDEHILMQGIEALVTLCYST